MALGFRDSEALRVVLASGVCPAGVVGRGARVGHGADGGLVLSPDQRLPYAALHQLRSLGVAIDVELPFDVRRVCCWAEAVAAQRVAVDAMPSQLLLLTERSSDLVDLAAELVRLGCDRQELLVAGDAGAIRVIDAPTYTVMRALDREGGLRGFSPDPGDQDAVWTELGYRHPLVDRLRAAPGTLLLVGGERWSALPEAGWVGLDAALELTVPGAETLAPARGLARRTIELRLSGGRRAAPSLWVLRKGGVAALDKLLEYLPEDVVARLTFAATSGDEPVVIVRARGGRHAPPELALAAEAYAPLADLPDVYAPADSIVEPPLRRERLRAILGDAGGAGASAAGEVLWLAPLPERRFRVERIPDSAFQPLADWGDYVLHASAPALVPWMRATELEFAPMVSSTLAWPSAPIGAPAPEPRTERPAAGALSRALPAEAVVMPPTAPAVDEAEPPAPDPIAPSTSPVAEVVVDSELAALEIEFVELDAPGDAPERLALLDRLATAYARLGRRRDAALCFARGVWDAPPGAARARLDAWITADRGLGGDGALAAILARTAPHLDDVRLVAALAARAHEPPGPGPLGRAAAELARDPHRVQRWLDDHDGELDARTLWLSRVGLARLVGGDQLGLARARDRILARLAGGLPVERELPEFLQFAGRTGALGDAHGGHLGRALDDLAQRIATTQRRRSVNEAPLALTGAYVELQLAYGYARIGRHERARDLVARADRALAHVASDPVHAYLIAAFEVRIGQAITGAAPETPLPQELGARLAALDRLSRFKVDRLREASRILEPLLRLDAFGVYIQGHGDSRGPEFVVLRQLPTPAARAHALGGLATRAAASEPDRERLVDGILDALLELPEAEAVPILARTWPLIQRLAEPRRAVLFAKAVVVAGHFGRTALVTELLALLGAAIRVVAGPDLERALHQSLRALRRIGLRTEIAELLADAEHALSPGPEALHGRLALSGGLAFLGETARALAIFDQARLALGANLLLATRLELTRALALAYAQAPLRNALGGIAELADQLRDITDSLGTNSHYCLSVLHFVESLVLGITSDDLALSDSARRFVEDDEHLIRRRVHRDLEALRDR